MEYTELLERQIMTRLRIDNPWWTENDIPDFFSILSPRLYLDRFYNLVKDTDIRRAILLMGPRRVGKTVMMYHTIRRLIDDGVPSKNIIYLSIETPIYNNIILETLLSLACKIVGGDMLRDNLYVFFDEIQYLKNWEVNLKSLVDTYRQIRFVASGSAAAELRKKGNESGAGRFTDFRLPPLTFYEYIHLKGYSNLMVRRNMELDGSLVDVYDTIDINKLNELFVDYINFGGYPEVVFSSKIRENPGQFIRHDIIDKVLLRDLPSMYGINDVQELNSLFTMIAYYSGSQFSYEKLSKESGIQKDTIRKYLNYLEAAFLIKVLRRTDDTAKNYKRETQFKIYLTNSSLRCALFEPINEHDSEMGNMVETAVFAQWFPRQGVDLRYANWRQGRQEGEVDMVGLNVGRQKPAWAIEIKWSNMFFNSPGDLKSLIYFMNKNDFREAISTTITHGGKKSVDNKTIHYLPVACYVYTVSKNTVEQYQKNNGL